MGHEDRFRRCGRCGLSKPLGDFAWRRKAIGQLDNYCRPCRATYKREQHYEANRDRYIKNALVRKRTVARERLLYLLELFRNRPCADCGETDPLVLEFDHRSDKQFSISSGGDRGWTAVLDELAKCDVVCANCHRRRTALRRGFTRAVVAQWQSLGLPSR